MTTIQRGPASGIRFGLLGPVRAGHRGADAVIPAPRQRILLAALLLRPGQAVSVDELAELVWDGEPPTGAVTTLRSYVMRLRRALGPEVGARLRTRAPGYLVELAEDAELDVLLFGALRRGGQDAAARHDWSRAAAELDAALELWRGAPLEDVPDGILKERELPSLAESRLQTHELLARADLELGRAGAAVERVLRLRAEHPFREQLSCLLMRAQVAAGRPAEALAEFARLRRTLVDELGVEPGEHSRALHAAVLAERPLPPWPSDGAPPPAAAPAGGPPGRPVPAQLPSALRDFTGRASQLGYLCDALGAPPPATEPGTAPLALICGVGGVGKTTLAVQVAHRLAAGYPDGQLFLNLRGAGGHPLAPRDALAALLRAFGTEDATIPRDEEERAALYRSVLAGRRVLIVLDDARDSAQLRPLLPGTATCGVLVTSRNRCATLSVSARTELGPMDRDEAARLFGVVAGVARVHAEPEAGARILDACGQHPLAVRIAGARLVARPDWSLSGLADRLDERRHRLEELAVDDLGVRVSFGLSYDTLTRSAAPADQEAARTFRMLGLWEGGEISLPAVAALTGCGAEETRRALDRLMEIHFVQEPEPGRYALHDLLRLFARERVPAPRADAGTRAAADRLAAWYLHATYQAMEQVKPERTRSDLAAVPAAGDVPRFDSYRSALSWLDRELPNVLAVTRQAAELGNERATQLLPTEVMHYLLMRREFRTLVEAHGLGLESARRTGDLAQQAIALNCMAHAHMELKEIDEALAAAHQALDIQTRRGDVHGQAAATESIGMTLHFAGRNAEALSWLRRALPLRRRAGNLFGLVANLNNLGVVYEELGRTEEAAETYRELVPVAREAGYLAAEETGLLNLGQTLVALGRLAEAEPALRACLELTDRTDNRFFRGTALSALGDLLAAREDATGALRAWRAALEAFDGFDDPSVTAVRQKIAAAGRTPTD